MMWDVGLRVLMGVIWMRYLEGMDLGFLMDFDECRVKIMKI